MYGIYGDIIGAAQSALECFEETKELLEYPEVQADKAYYLSVLSKYNNLNFLKEKLTSLISSLEEERALSALLAEANTDEERGEVYKEISRLKADTSRICAALCDALGCKHIEERAYCRLKFKGASVKFATSLYSLIKSYLTSHGAKVEDENLGSNEISFIADGADVITRLTPLTGAHKVYIAQAKSEELCFAVTPSANVQKVSDSDLKIDVFHSHGAGGQNINKVETAVRVTHISTGITVVCQDERSQLKNKRRAIETIKKRLSEKSGQAEKNRIEADICAQYSKKNTPISFDAVTGTMTDTRLKAFSKIPFPCTDGEFNSYIDGLTAL